VPSEPELARSAGPLPLKPYSLDWAPRPGDDRPITWRDERAVGRRAGPACPRRPVSV